MIIKELVSDLAQFQAAFDELKPMSEKYGLNDLGRLPELRHVDGMNTA